MVEIVWEFVVKEGAIGQFELAYGPGGAWSNLFARSPGFRGITVLRDTKNRRRYLAIDVWDTEGQREQTLAECEGEYAELEAALGEWTESGLRWASSASWLRRRCALVAEQGGARPEGPVEAATGRRAEGPPPGSSRPD